MSTFTTSSGASTNTIPTLPHEKRHWPINYTNHDGTVGETRYPINYDELYNLKGRLLTLIDATNADATQRKALKDLIWATLRDWMTDVEHAGANAHANATES